MLTHSTSEQPWLNFDVHGRVGIRVAADAGRREGELLARARRRRLAVNTFHHQAIDDPGTFVPTGWCPDDRVIEIIEDPERTFALGVQWHPERTGDLRVFAALVSAAGRRSTRRRPAFAA